MNFVALRAFNLIPGAVFDRVDFDGGARVVREVFRNADDERVLVNTRLLHNLPDGTNKIETFNFDYCENIDLIGLVVNIADNEDEDNGNESYENYAADTSTNA